MKYILLVFCLLADPINICMLVRIQNETKREKER